MPLMSRPNPRPRPRNKRQPRHRPKPVPTRHGFTLSTQLTKATGDKGNYALDHVQALPGPRSNTVLLQASDGHQAVCLVSPGDLDQPVTLPRRLLRNLKTTESVEVQSTSKGWTASNGQTSPDKPLERFPPIAEALPKFSNRRHADDHLSLSIDVSLLTKITEALGTSKLTLLLPRPAEGDSVLSKAIAVCPAVKPEGHQPDGIAVLMPLKADLGAKYYRKVRRDVVAAEASLKPQPVAASA